MKPGKQYEDVAVEKRLVGRVAAREHGSGSTKKQLYDQAKRLKIEGRSRMTKAELARAVKRTAATISNR